MTTFDDLKEEVGGKIQKTAAAYLTKIGAWLNRRYEVLWQMYPWTAITVIDEPVVATAGSSALYLPKGVGQVICLTQRATNAIILPTSPYVFQNKYLDEITTQSDPFVFTYDGESPVKAQPASASKITVESSASDTSIKIRIWGLVGTEEMHEVLTLTGTTPVESANTYSKILQVSKDSATTGYVTVKAGSTALATIAPEETAPEYVKLILHYTPASAVTVYCTYKRRFRKLVNPEDIIQIPCLEPTLIRLGYADCLKEQGRRSQGESEEQGAWSELNNLIVGTEVQKLQTHQMIPHVERSDFDTPWRG